MKNKLSLVLVLSGMSLSMYPATVLITNETAEKVWARINDQKRQHARVEVQRKRESQQEAAAYLTALASTVVVEPTARIKQAVGFSAFFPIDPGSKTRLGTALVAAHGGERGHGLGRPIKSITFLRVTGNKKITGTVSELKKQVKEIAHNYANMSFDVGRKKATYLNDFNSSTNKEWEYKKNKKYTIEVPVFEKFTYTLDPSILLPERNKVVLKSWGNVDRL